MTAPADASIVLALPRRPSRPRSRSPWVLPRVRQEGGVDCGAQSYRVATETSHFIQSLDRQMESE